MLVKNLRRGPGIVLLCWQCQSEYSSNPNDYWDRDPNEELTCECCDLPLEMVCKETTFRVIGDEP